MEAQLQPLYMISPPTYSRTTYHSWLWVSVTSCTVQRLALLNTLSTDHLWSRVVRPFFTWLCKETPWLQFIAQSWLVIATIVYLLKFWDVQGAFSCSSHVQNMKQFFKYIFIYMSVSIVIYVVWDHGNVHAVLHNIGYM